MRRQMVDLQCLDMFERSCRIETGDVWNRCMRSEVEENLFSFENACASAIQRNLKRFRSRETPGAHDQFRAGRLIEFEVLGNLAFDHRALALANRNHVNGRRAGHHADLRGVTGPMGDPCARDLILGGHAGDVRARAADPPPLDDGRPPPGLRQMPGDQLAARTAAKDEYVISLCLSLGLLLVELGFSSWNAVSELRR